MTETLVPASRGDHASGAANATAAAPPAEEAVSVVHLRGVVEVQRNGDVRAAALTPVHTVRAGGNHHGVVTAHFDPGWSRRASDLPMGSVTTRDHHSIVVPYYGTGEAQAAATRPVGAISTRDRFALVVPSNGLAPQPAAAIGPAPPEAPVVFTDADIDACRFRMFALQEIAAAMVMHKHTTGQPYRVVGNKRERMAQYGNSVTPPAMAWLIGRLLEVIQAERVVDLFCGAGGSSLGAELAGARLALGLNHWQRAVETHATNFQHADHDCEDISSLTTAQIRRYLAHARADILIGGPECTNHSIAKGGRRVKPRAASLFDDGPAGDNEQDKSRATMWDMVRFAEQALLAGKPFKAIVVENVVDAFRWGANDDGGLFNAWLNALDSLGYRHEIVWLNSMFAPPAPDPAPQSRDRMYVVFWRKGIRTPNLRVEPPAWCLHCQKVVLGQQTWKKPGQRPWGRYGAQYTYNCPDCFKTALPGAFPAASIIDHSLPAERIGDRAKPLAVNTRERIRRGLERLGREPFAVRLLQGGQAKPTTLPLVTLTARHDMGMVLPVAGNTFERTPGNRARDAATTPLDTVHGTLDRAIVMANTENAVPRTAEHRPTPTLRTAGGMAIVVPASSTTADGAEFAKQTRVESRACGTGGTVKCAPDASGEMVVIWDSGPSPTRIGVGSVRRAAAVTA
jgi:DNA (cytosine-5)-methyltransferase 1